MQNLKVRKIGNSLGVILPREALDALGASEGDELVVSRNAVGELSVRRNEPDFDQQVRAAEKIMERYRNALADLAK